MTKCIITTARGGECIVYAYNYGVGHTCPLYLGVNLERRWVMIDYKHTCSLHNHFTEYICPGKRGQNSPRSKLIIIQKVRTCGYCRQCYTMRVTSRPYHLNSHVHYASNCFDANIKHYHF